MRTSKSVTRKRTIGVVFALRAAVFLKRMKGFRWKQCAPRGCNRLFVLTLSATGFIAVLHVGILKQ